MRSAVMYSSMHPSRHRSLVEAEDGEQVELGTVVFEVIRRVCDTIGVHSGDVLYCERRTPQAVVLRRDNGQCIEVDRVYAAFIEIHGCRAI